MMRLVSRRLVLAAAALAPAGCAGLLPAAGTPPRLYKLTPASDFPPNLPRVTSQLLVDVPAAAAALDTDRIAVSHSPITVDYFAASVWTDRAPLMVQSLLVESFENSRRITAVARESLALQADYILLPELRHFEADYAGNAGGPPRVHVQIGVKLVKMPSRTIVARRSFDAAAPAAENEIAPIIDAFNAALHPVLRQTVEWTLSTMR